MEGDASQAQNDGPVAEQGAPPAVGTETAQVLVEPLKEEAPAAAAEEDTAQVAAESSKAKDGAPAAAEEEVVQAAADNSKKEECPSATDLEAAQVVAENLKKEGNEAFKAKRYDEAISKYTEAIRMDPSSHILHSNRAMCHGAMNAWEPARADAQRAVELSVGEYPKAFFHLARAQLRLGSLGDAKKTLTEALRRFQALGKYPKEVRDFLSLLQEVEQEVIQQQPCAEEMKRQGNEAFKAKKYEEAILKYTAAIELDPSNHILYSNRAMCHGALEAWTLALQDARCAIRLSSGTFAKAYFHVARAELRLGDPEKAEATLLSALKKFDSTGQYPKEMNDCKALLEEVEQALVLKTGKPRPKAEKYKEEGNTKYKAQQYRSCLTDYTKAIEAAEAEEAEPPRRATYLGNRAAAYLMLKEPDKCIADCRAALGFDPTAGKIWQRLCSAQVALGDFAGALAAADEGVAVEGLMQGDALKSFRGTAEQLQSQWQEGDAALNAGEFRTALRMFMAVEERGVTASEKLALLMGRCRMMQGEHLPVLNLTKDILKQNPQCVDAYVLRAEALYMSNEVLLESPQYDDKIEESMKLLKRALDFDPDHSDAQHARKRLKSVSSSVSAVREKMNNRDFEAALGLIESALEIDPRNKRLSARLYEQRAKANLRMQRYEMAIKDAAQATYHDHELRDAYMTRATAYQKLGKHEEAVQTWESLAQWCREELIFQRLWDAKFQMRKAKREDLYALLGVPSVASLPEIKKGYREKAAQWHPDKKSHLDETTKKNAEAVFKRINEAHEILTDPVRKQWWDEGYDEEAIKERLEMKKQKEAQGRNGGHGHGHGHMHAHY